MHPVAVIAEVSDRRRDRRLVVYRPSLFLLGLTRQTPPTTDHRLDFAC